MRKILNFATWLVFGLFWISLASIDSESWTPFLVLIGCWIWLAIAAWKKGWFYGQSREDEADV